MHYYNLLVETRVAEAREAMPRRPTLYTILRRGGLHYHTCAIPPHHGVTYYHRTERAVPLMRVTERAFYLALLFPP